MSFTDLGKATGLSTSAVHQRVKRLEQRGIIQGYAALIDHTALDLPLTALISIRPIDPAQPDDSPGAPPRRPRDRVLLLGRRRLQLRPDRPGRHPGRAGEPPRRHPSPGQRLHHHHDRPQHPVRTPPTSPLIGEDSPRRRHVSLLVAHTALAPTRPGRSFVARRREAPGFGGVSSHSPRGSRPSATRGLVADVLGSPGGFEERASRGGTRLASGTKSGRWGWGSGLPRSGGGPRW